MRIAITTNFYPPIQTGTAHFAKDLAKALAERGYSVLVVTVSPGGEASDDVEAGLRVVRLPSRRLPRLRLLMGFDDFRLVRGREGRALLMDALASHNPDVVHQCGHLLDLTYLVTRAARRLGVPSVCSLHTQIHLPGRRWLDRIVATIDRRVVNRYAMRVFDAIMTFDAGTEAYAQSRYPDTRRVRAPYAIDFPFERHHRIPGEHQELRIVSVGHVTEMRPRLTLLEAVRILVDEGVPLRLRIIGKECTPVTRERMDALGLADVVELTGALPREAVLEEMSRSDAHAGNWLTHNPGLGSAGMESMAMGLPTLAWSDPDLMFCMKLQHMENALLIEPDDPQNIAAVLRKLAGDRAFVAQIGMKARESAEQALRWDRAAAKMELVYADIRRRGSAP